MATVAQLLKQQQLIQDVQAKLDSQKLKRQKLIEDLNFKEPNYIERRSENFVSIDGKPHRIWVYVGGYIEVEEIII